MEHFNHVELSYRDLGPGEELYDDIDLTHYDIVDAQYRREEGYEGIPDICALPSQKFNDIDVLNQGLYFPRVLDNPDWGNKACLTQMYMANDFRLIRIPLLAYQDKVEEGIHSTLRNSYVKRSFTLTENKYDVMKKITSDITTISDCEPFDGTPPGVGLYGTPGTGKTTAIGIAIKNIPAGIRHSIKGFQYIQIPYVPLTATPRSNISALFIQFANYLDKLLETGDMHYKIISKEKINLGGMALKIVDWVNLYHIGIIILDEVQFIETKNQSGLEQFVTIMALTQVGLFISGNVETLKSWESNFRLTRRFFSRDIPVHGLKYDDNFRYLVKLFWARTIFCYEGYTLTDELVQELQTQSVGIIDLLVTLLISIQLEWIREKAEIERIRKRASQEKDKIRAAYLSKKGEALSLKHKFNLDYIRNIANRDIAHLRILGEARLKSDEDEFSKERMRIKNEQQRCIDHEKEAEKQDTIANLERDLDTGYDHYGKMCMVVDSILCTDRDGRYTDKKIQLAFNHAEKCIDGFKRLGKRAMVKAVLDVLDSRKSEAKKKVDTSKKPDSDKKNQTAEELDRKIKSFNDELSENMKNDFGLPA